MKSFGNGRKNSYMFCEYMYLVGTGSAGILGWINGLENKERWLATRPILWSAIEYIQERSVYIYIGIALIVAFSFLYRRLGDPWALEKIQFILDEYQGKVFAANNAPKDHDRVTIFKHEKNCILAKHWSSTKWYMPWGDKPPLSNYLVPYLRSGHMSKKSSAIFYAPDGSDKAEGVAAMAWARKQSVVVNDLPAIGSTTSNRDIEKYSKATKCAKGLLVRYQKEGRQPPRSIAAIPIERKGELWGVVVLDSRSPLGVTNHSVEHYTLTVALIGHLLEKA
ncbi:GAF domain-containing protein [Pseudomonas helleri]|uniref:GAF domain-containing protein n=1 Tax=Pseudomonas helleri TaxID=1608996 RepID=UPI0037C97520